VGGDRQDRMRYPPLNGAPSQSAAAARRPPRAKLPPLIAVAHGSSDPHAAATVTDLIGVVQARARERGLPGLQARAAYLGHALPSVPAVLESLQADGHPAVVVLPLLLTPAYHSDTDLPAILREQRNRLPGLRIRYGQPLGPHARLLRALERRLAETAPEDTTGPQDTVAPEDTAVVLAAAGSSRPRANAAVARLAAQWRSARGWRAVIPAYASAAPPTPAGAVAGLLSSGAKRVVVAAYLLAPGSFADQVRQQSLAAGAHVVSAPLGAAPEVADVLIERYQQAALPGDAAAAARLRASLRR
jgi:sirohydrochlorin ferrochelatase